MMALIKDMQNEKEHPGHPKLVVSNNINAEGLVFAKQHSIETFTFNVENLQSLGQIIENLKAEIRFELNSN